MTADIRHMPHDHLRFYDRRGRRLKEVLVMTQTDFSPPRSIVLSIGTGYIPKIPGFYQKVLTLLGSAG
jgi:hypothetical protein